VIGRKRRRTSALLTAALLTGLLALPIMVAAPAQAQDNQVQSIEPLCANAPDESDASDDAQFPAAHAEAIRCLMELAWFLGNSDGSFGANQNILRMQMASVMLRKLDDATGFTRPAATDEFPEENCGVHDANVNAAASTTPPLTVGFSDGSFRCTLNVTRGQMASFIVRQLEVAGADVPDCPPASATPRFTDIAGSAHRCDIERLAAMGITVGRTATTFEPDDPVLRGEMASFEARAGAELVEQDLMEPLPAPGGVGGAETSLPELASAAIVGTTTTAQQTAAQPAGTRVRFVFDEDVQETGQGAPTATEFFIHDQNNVRSAGVAVTGVTPTVEADNRSVVVNFPAVATTEAATALTLATVDDGAVRDTEGNPNPEGDAPIGTAGSSTVGGPGITSAPDLIDVNNFRDAAAAGRTAVDFTFDQAAFRTTGANAGAFMLVFKDASETTCEPPASASTEASGTTSAGGEGTSKFTVICTNPGVTEVGGQVINPGTDITADQVARGTVGQGAVASTAAQAGTAGAANQNPLQAQAPDKGPESAKTTPQPDLESVTLTPGTGGARDAAVFTFDQPIGSVGAPELFAVYKTDGTEIAATGPGGADNPTINPTPPAGKGQVRVTFPAGTLTNIAGANVRDAAVRGTGNAPNDEDEVGAGTATTVTRTPGVTTGPQLTAVALSEPSPGFGFRAMYTFDEPVTLQTGATQGAPTQASGQTLFHLFAADGTRYTSTACTVGTDATTNTQVTCTNYNVAATTTAATGAQIGAATLGTADFAAVFGAGGAQGNPNDRNPEGAASTTGGTTA